MTPTTPDSRVRSREVVGHPARIAGKAAQRRRRNGSVAGRYVQQARNDGFVLMRSNQIATITPSAGNIDSSVRID